MHTSIRSTVGARQLFFESDSEILGAVRKSFEPTSGMLYVGLYDISNPMVVLFMLPQRRGANAAKMACVGG